MKGKDSVRLFFICCVVFCTFFISQAAIAEPKGVAHKVEALSAQFLEMKNELDLVRQENIRLINVINQLVGRVRDLSDSNTELSNKIACIDPSLSTDSLLAIDCNVIFSNSDPQYRNLINNSVVETENIYNKENSELNIGSDDDLYIDAIKSVIESRDEILLKAGKSEISMKKNGDITIQGKKISIKATGDIILKGSKIIQN